MAGIDDPRTLGLLQAAFGILDASGPQLRPTSIGQALARGGSAGIGAYQQQKKNLADEQLSKIREQLLRAQIAETLAQSQERTANAEKLKKLAAQGIPNEELGTPENCSPSTFQTATRFHSFVEPCWGSS